MSKQQYEVFKRYLRKCGQLPRADDSTIGRRAALVAQVANCERDGEVLIARSGTDCDGRNWESGTIVPAIPRAIEHAIDHAYDWADGPTSAWIEPASNPPYYHVSH